MKQLSDEPKLRSELTYNEMMMTVYDRAGTILHSLPSDNTQARLSLPGFGKNYLNHAEKTNNIRVMMGPENNDN